MQIYIADTTALSDEELFWKYMDQVDETRRKKVFQCRREEDRKRSLLAGYLIQKGMKERMQRRDGQAPVTVPLPLSYAFAADGKPCILNEPDIHFSLSHSGKYVTAVFDEAETGIDIQYHRELKTDVAKRFFSEEDRKLSGVFGENGNEQYFYRLWTIKEAYMKLTGEGLRQGLDSTIIVPDETDKTIGRIRKREGEQGAWYRLYDTLIEKYSLAVCSFSQISDTEIKEVRLTDDER